ncbi:hypothetical protein M8C21_026861, partial [Ambrosia artemisiifolia]
MFEKPTIEVMMILLITVVNIACSMLMHVTCSMLIQARSRWWGCCSTYFKGTLMKNESQDTVKTGLGCSSMVA